MTDELDKLGAELKKVGPSDASREIGMNAAMAAFDQAFADSTLVERNMDGVQGSEAQSRLTGQEARKPRAEISGSGILSKINSLFSFDRKATMMMGTCAAALMAAIVVLPLAQQEFQAPQSQVSDIASEIEMEPLASKNVEPMAEPVPETSDEIVVTGSRVTQDQVGSSDDVQTVESEPDAPAPEPESQDNPYGSVPGGSVTSISELVDMVRSKAANAEKNAEEPTVEFRQERSRAEPLEAESQAFSASPFGEIQAEPPAFKATSRDTAAAENAPTQLPPLIIQIDDGAFTNNNTSSPRIPDQLSGGLTLEEVPAEVTDKDQAFVALQGTNRDEINRSEVTPQRYLLRDASGQIVREFANRDQFEAYKANPIVPVRETPVSTFSVDVDTASYAFMRASVNRGNLPAASSIRLEEMINYFPYDYTAPTSADEPFKANVTVTPTPWNADTKLMHIGIQGYDIPASDQPKSNLVFLIDSSGSMNDRKKLPLLIESFKLLLETLDEDDTVSIVTYASSTGTVLEPTPASEIDKIMLALTNIRANGSTAGAAGLALAYEKAEESFDKDAVNRVILATDGDFNVGFSSPDDMKSFVEDKRDSGIFLSVLGFGMGNYNDHLMQALAQNGNGVAAYIDTLSEARKVLSEEAGGTLFTIAKDVKIQVEFNPATISEYRLLGYETRGLKREDFNNDAVDAGEIGAGHSVTAIYELTPVGSPAQMVDSLRYADEAVPAAEFGSDEYAFIKIRHKLPSAQTSTLQTFPVGPEQERGLRQANNDTRFAAAVAAIGQKLRGDVQVQDFGYDEALDLAMSAKGDDPHGYRTEFIELVERLRILSER